MDMQNAGANLTDSTLERARKGDSEAFNKVFMSHYASLLASAKPRYGILKEDIVNSVYLTAKELARELPSLPEIRKWLLNFLDTATTPEIQPRKRTVLYDDATTYSSVAPTQRAADSSIRQAVNDGLNTLLFNPPSELKALWSSDDSFHVGEKGYEYSRQLATFLQSGNNSGIDVDDWSSLFLNDASYPKGSLKQFSTETGIQPYQNATTLIRRHRNTFLANLFMLLIIQERHELIVPILSTQLSRSWRGGPLNRVLRSRETINAHLSNFSPVLRDLTPELHRHTRESLQTLRQSLNTGSLARSFYSAYLTAQVLAFYHPQHILEHFPTLHSTLSYFPSSNHRASFLVERILKRGQNMTNDRYWLIQWIVELYSLFEEAGPNARLFAVYETLYYENRLDDNAFSCLAAPDAADSVWSIQSMTKLVKQSWKNITDPLVRYNSLQLAINILRVAIYFRVCPNPWLLPEEQADLVKQMAGPLFLELDESRQKVHYQKIPGVDVEGAAKWLLGIFK